MDKWAEDVDRRLNYALGVGIDRQMLAAGDPIIVLTGSKAGEGNTCTIRVLNVPATLPIAIVNPVEMEYHPHF